VACRQLRCFLELRSTVPVLGAYFGRSTSMTVTSLTGRGCQDNLERFLVAFGVPVNARPCRGTRTQGFSAVFRSRRFRTRAVNEIECLSGRAGSLSQISLPDLFNPVPNIREQAVPPTFSSIFHSAMFNNSIPPSLMSCCIHNYIITAIMKMTRYALFVVMSATSRTVVGCEQYPGEGSKAGRRCVK
jgi:hypothetical protein